MEDEGDTTRHLLNCRECGWYRVIEGPSMAADHERTAHEQSTWVQFDQPACPPNSVAWVFLGVQAEVG